MGRGKNKAKAKKTKTYVQYGASSNDSWRDRPIYIRIHIISNGILTICKAIDEFGAVDYFNWDDPNSRKAVRNNVNTETVIVVDDNVYKGWNYE